MNKYLVKETVPYESEMTWTVFANTPEEAKEFVRKERDYQGESLEHTLMIHDVKGGRGEKGILKKSGRKYYE